jgi:hypothetical protein
MVREKTMVVIPANASPQSLAGDLIGSPPHQQSVELRPDRGEINFQIEADPVGFSMRASNITIHTHGHCIANFPYRRNLPSGARTLAEVWGRQLQMVLTLTATLANTLGLIAMALRRG